MPIHHQRFKVKIHRSKVQVTPINYACFAGSDYIARKHSSEAFYVLDDLLEAMMFSVLVEIIKVDDQAIVKQSPADYGECLPLKLLLNLILAE